MLYTGFTGNMTQRLEQHFNKRGTSKTFTGKYYAYKLIYYELYQYASEGIAREKQIKRWSRAKKENLINMKNPNWLSLNREFDLDD